MIKEETKEKLIAVLQLAVVGLFLIKALKSQDQASDSKKGKKKRKG